MNDSGHLKQWFIHFALCEHIANNQGKDAILCDAVTQMPVHKHRTDN